MRDYKIIIPLIEKQLNAKVLRDIILKTDPARFTVVGGNVKFHIETDKKIDKELQKEQLTKDLEYQKGFLLSVEKKLSNERFVQNAKPEVVEVEKKKKADAEAKIKAIEESLASL